MATSLNTVACCLTIPFFLLWLMAFEVALIKNILGACLCLCVCVSLFLVFLRHLNLQLAIRIGERFKAM